MIRKNRPLRDNFILIGSICTLLVAMIVWASIFKIIQTARAQGQVIAIARTQVIQAAIDVVLSRRCWYKRGRLSKGETSWFGWTTSK